MSDDEWFVAIVSTLISTIYWGRWFYVVGQTNWLIRPHRRFAVLFLCLVACIALNFATLRTSADPIVRDSPAYIFLFMMVSGVALASVTIVGNVIGVNAIDDAIRRSNSAAVVAICGVWIGTSLIVSGANIGRGDTIATTIGPMALGVATLVVLWAVFAVIVGMSSIIVDRDLPSALRLAGLLIAWGLILGRATAGDWESVERTWHDFAVQGWPCAVLLLVTLPIAWRLRPSVQRRLPSFAIGVLPAFAYLLVALGWVTWLGRP